MAHLAHQVALLNVIWHPVDDNDEQSDNMKEKRGLCSRTGLTYII